MRIPVKRLTLSRRSIELAAARWTARRDRGLSPREQDAYLQWLSENRAHRGAVVRLERTWRRLDVVRQWHSGPPKQVDPDLLAPHIPRQPWIVGALILAAAILLVVVP